MGNGSRARTRPHGVRGGGAENPVWFPSVAYDDETSVSGSATSFAPPPLPGIKP
jgi:hypothetical protein